MTTRCSECGAEYSADGDSCQARFEQLLALDHSRREPWGSRHGQAFAAFALQHPQRYASSLDHAWAALQRIYVAGNRPSHVFEQLRSNRGSVPRDWRVPVRPKRPVAAPSFTIADLGDFDATTYAELLDDWCRASLVMWGASSAPRAPLRRSRV
jgi:hypothetical protein